VQRHTKGLKAATPDIAGDLERTIAVVTNVARRLHFLVEPRAALAVCIAAHLELVETGDPREHVIKAVMEEGHHILEEEIRRASTELSETTGLTPSALRTRPGWNDALARDGHGDGRLPDLDDLPGTLTVLSVKNLVDLVSLRRAFTSRDLYADLCRVWNSTKTSGKGFDAVIDGSGSLQENVSRIGWALITLEGRRHINLIWHQANKLQRSFPDREASELLTWGWLGLRTALRNYNPGLGFAFSTYAVTRIVGAIRDGVRAESPVPKRLGTLARKVAVVEADLARSLGRAPTMSEIGAALNLESAQLAVVRRTRTPASIEEIVAGLDRSGGNEPDWLADLTDTAEVAVTRIVGTAVGDALAELPPEEAEAIRLLVIEDRTPTEARLIAGVTARQLRQRKERGLNTLRSRLENLDPDLDKPSV
jgi:RNA polymerase sigma factor (sigma-70 family)